MTIFRIALDAYTDGKKDVEDPELEKLIRECSENLKSFDKWAQKMEAERKFARKAIPPLKNSTRDFYRELDKKLADKKLAPDKKKTLTELRKMANSVWIELDTLYKAMAK